MVDNKIEDKGTIIICETLKENTSLTSLNLWSE